MIVVVASRVNVFRITTIVNRLKTILEIECEI